MTPTARHAELAANLARVEERMAKACADAGRRRSELTLVVVTKTWPVEDVRLLAELGVLDLGESRDQEARVKAASCADLGLRWHFLGQLQRNKARSVAGYADLVHTVDRESLAEALARGRAGSTTQPLPVLVQVSLDGDPARGGARAEDVPALASAVAGHSNLRLRGLMAVAPLGCDPAAAFARLRTLSVGLRREHPEAQVISAGMSADLEPAIRAGATHLRVGSAVLGSRPLLR